MPKIIKVHDELYEKLGGPAPLRITVTETRPPRGKGQPTRSPSIRVKCGCCPESVVIFHATEPADNPHNETLEINGVIGSLSQWRKILAPLLKTGVPDFAKMKS